MTGDALRGSWRDVRRLAADFERLWYNDYLGTLRPFSKWTTSTPNLRLGQLILLPGEGVPRHLWRMARVDKIISEGSHVRRVVVRTADGHTYERHVNNLILLEMDVDGSR